MQHGSPSITISNQRWIPVDRVLTTQVVLSVDEVYSEAFE